MSLYNDYYDKLYADKDYAGEAAIVGSVLRKVSSSPVVRVLDVGCGTGRHARAMAALGFSVTGVDIDAAAISIARARSANVSPAPNFVAGLVTDVAETGFDAAVSLFNVVNYLTDAKALLAYFGAIHDRLKPAAPFVFDSWNGLAAVLDPPRTKVSEISADGEDIRAETIPFVDLMAQTVRLETKVEVRATGKIRHTFDHQFQHRLWMPQDLKDLLAVAGFTVLSVSAWMKPDVPANVSTWKILFSCQRT
jgi:SAM-dependent methyltransferase